MMNTKVMIALACVAMTGCGSMKHSDVEADAGSEMQGMAATAPSTQTAGGPATIPSAVVSPLPTVATTGPATIPAVALAPAQPRQFPANADEATLARNWSVSICNYQNGHVIAGPVYRISPPNPRSNATSDVVAEELFGTALVIPQMLFTPVWVLMVPPYTAVEYHGDIVPPSYTVDEPRYDDSREKIPGWWQMRR